MSLSAASSLYPRPINAPEESIMTATYTFDVFSSLDGFGSASGGDWGGYWGKQGPELLDHRLALYSEEQRMVFGANTYRLFAQMLASSTEESEVRDPWVARMVAQPAIIVSNTLEEPLDWPSQNGSDAIFQGAADFDLELIESQTLDGNIQELTYRPTLHV